MAGCGLSLLNEETRKGPSQVLIPLSLRRGVKTQEMHVYLISLVFNERVCQAPHLLPYLDLAIAPCGVSYCPPHLKDEEELHHFSEATLLQSPVSACVLTRLCSETWLLDTGHWMKCLNYSGF